MINYGVFIGRFQPFHLGHEAIIHEIIADGLVPIIIIGSANIKDSRNPWSVMDRCEMIRLVFPDIIIFTANDHLSYDKWWTDMQVDLISTDIYHKSVFYINNKEQDRCDFILNGKEYKNSFYTEIFRNEGCIVKEVTYPKLLNIPISASKIRDDIRGYRHYLDGRVYNYISGCSSAW
jgi:bifunctional NMN adenylyltransferase/nudix hydrolase